MASQVDICNIALSHIGADAVVSSIDPPDGSVEAGHCARFLPIARRELIETNAWAFTKKRYALAEVTNDSKVWAYAYAIPANMVNALRVLQTTYLTAMGFVVLPGSYLSFYTNWQVVDDLFTERGSASFELESTQAGDIILRTNEPDAVLLYTADVTDTTLYSPMFSNALGMLLASYLAGPIIKGSEGASIGAAWRKQAYMLAEAAAASNANSASERADHVSEMLRARL